MTAAGGRNRLGAGGRIDRATPLSFTFDGWRLAGFAGDTVASALLANGVRLTGRSFKYHRPRGILTAGPEEPAGLVTLGSDGRREPNVAATMAELFEGLEVRSQNAWPSRRFDLMAVNGALAPFLAAGFYYKTFMGPSRRAWMLYEPFIRRAAGLGEASRQADSDAYEKLNAFADVLVVGGGPAGLSAALAAGRAGARVVLAEQTAALGGALLSEPMGGPADAWLGAVVGELRTLPTVRILTRATVYGAYDGGVFGLVERVADHKGEPAPGEPRQRHIVLRARAAVIAAGAIERPIPFGNNDRPGVMLAGAARTYLNRFAVLPGKRIVLFTNNDGAYAAARDLSEAGAEVTVIDARPDTTPAGQDAAHRGIEVIAGHAVVETSGQSAVRGVTVSPFDVSSGTCGDGFSRRRCDLVLMSGGHDPQVHLAAQRGTRPVWNEALACFVPGAMPDIQRHAGAMTGAFATADCVAQGFAAGAVAASQVGFAGQPGAPPAFHGEQPAVVPIAPVWDVEPPGSLRRQKRFIDFQNDVAASDVALAHREGYVSVEHLKRYTTLGMATDQGKLANVVAIAQMAKLRGIAIADAGTTGYRAPYTSVVLGALASAGTGAQLALTRQTPLRRFAERHGARFLNVDLWQRASHFPRANEDVETACRREARDVRRAVGLTDISTLGKIEVQGPDAAEFLDRVYVNAMASLPVGMARYGVMLREDGFVLDDGVAARLTGEHYFVTTSTAEASKVLTHLEWLISCAWPDLRVHVTSVIDQWAGVAIAGPYAKKLVAETIRDIDFDNAAFPRMGVRTGSMGGIAVRCLRVSFSGELAYEVYCPAGHGDALADFVIEFGRRHGIGLYGLEALGTLRIEKGHLTGAEIDGRHTLEDLGLQGLASKTKPFVGSVLRARQAMQDPDRPRLAGFKPVDPKHRIRSGMILQPKDGPTHGHGLGHIGSAAFSVAAGCHIGLGFLAGKEARMGSVILAVYPLDGDIVPVVVGTPHSFDPRGERLHG